MSQLGISEERFMYLQNINKTFSQCIKTIVRFYSEKFHEEYELKDPILSDKDMVKYRVDLCNYIDKKLYENGVRFDGDRILVRIDENYSINLTTIKGEPIPID